MIDTVVLTLKEREFSITDRARFKVLRGPGAGSVSRANNPGPNERRTGKHYPRLTLRRQALPGGGVGQPLRVEFSAPKLIFGNNFDELQDDDFDRLLLTLKRRLASRGVTASVRALSTAAVSSIHYSKNIILTDGSTPSMYLREIARSNTPMYIDVNQTDYRNDGHLFKWHTNSYEVAFYDKVKDLGKAKTSERRAVENYNAIQTHLIAKRRSHPFEVLRMEVRIGDRKKLKSVLSRTTGQSDLGFRSLFGIRHAKAILQHSLAEIDRGRIRFADHRVASDQALLAYLSINHPGFAPAKILALFGLHRALQSMTPRELKGVFSPSRQHSLRRLLEAAKDVRLTLSARDPLEAIRSSIAAFRPVRLADLTSPPAPLKMEDPRIEGRRNVDWGLYSAGNV